MRKQRADGGHSRFVATRLTPHNSQVSEPAVPIIIPSSYFLNKHVFNYFYIRWRKLINANTSSYHHIITSIEECVGVLEPVLLHVLAFILLLVTRQVVKKMIKIKIEFHELLFVELDTARHDRSIFL